MALDANGHYYQYSGSLTTPTCNEVVTWNVMEKPIYVSTSQARQQECTFQVVVKNLCIMKNSSQACAIW